MKSAFFIIVSLFLVGQSYGQEMVPLKLNKTDSVNLASVWSKFKKSLADEDESAIRNLSLSLVYCDLFGDSSMNDTSKDSFISVDTFAKQFFNHMSDSRLWFVVKTKKYHMTLGRALDFHPRNITLQKSKSLLIYQIWYVTWEPNELMKGHEGQTHAFEFVKVKGKFKFYGMTSIPKNLNMASSKCKFE